MKETIHYGNGNWKRTKSSCGAPANNTDTVDVNKITCMCCINGLIKRSYNPEKWKIRKQTLSERMEDDTRTI